MRNRKSLSRRDFIKISIIGTAALNGVSPLLAHQIGEQIEETPTWTETMPNGIAAGDATQNSVVLWTHSTAPGTVTFRYAASTAWWDYRARYTQSAEVSDPTIPVKVQVAHLQPDTEYVYQVRDAAGSRISGRFRTLPAADQPAKNGLHFGVTGDWRGELRPFVSVSNVAARKLDFFMELGDTIYADIPSLDLPAGQARTLAEYRIKHNEVYSARYDQNHWADIRASTGVYVVHDDHEVCDDYAGGAAPSNDARFDQTGDRINQTDLYKNGMQALSEFNPLRDEIYSGTGDARVEGRPKFYRSLTFGTTAAMIVLDARSFRDKEETQLSPTQVINPIALGRGLAAMFEPNRTMLGQPQLSDLKRDLLAAHEAGIIWKFIMIPEPIQHMGWFGGVDRWEGYAPERTEFLKFIEDNAIRNVVFITADVHTTFINNLTYQTEAGGAQIPTHCFEISTECAAFYPPTGQIIMDTAAEIGLLSKDKYDAYQKLPIPEKDTQLEELFNRVVLKLQGFTPLGLEDSLITWERTKGGWIVGHTFGWTEFEIAPETEKLTITTYGVPAYNPVEARLKSERILGYEPEIMSQLIITPQTT
ncbi:MAG: alkaline phosphatase D family protein [Chloroflexota bacterium]